MQFKMLDIPLFRLESDEDRIKCTNSPKFTVLQDYNYCALHVLEQVSTAFIAPGSRGGALMDTSGSLVGVASASDGAGFYFFVTLSDIKAFLNNY